MREQQNQAVRRNTRLYKSGKGGRFEVGDKVWYFQPKLIPSLCNKIRNYWQGPFKILKLVSPMLAEISTIFERGGVWTVSIDVLRPYNDKETAYSYGYESDVSPPETLGEGELGEVPHLMYNTGDYNLKRNYNAGVYLPEGADQGTGLTVPISINLPSPPSQNIEVSCPIPQNIIVELKKGKGKSKTKNVKGCKGQPEFHIQGGR